MNYANAKATIVILANKDYEFRIPRNPIRLGIAARQHERDLYQAGGECGPHSDSLARWPGDRPPRSAAERMDERPHVDRAGSTSPVLLDRRDTIEHRLVLHAAMLRTLDGGRPALAARLEHQHQHG